jgi:hypothetical protein
MAENLSGTAWAQWPMAGALGAGRSDETTPPPGGFGLTPSGQVEHDGEIQAAQPAEQEAPDAGHV